MLGVASAAQSAERGLSRNKATSGAITTNMTPFSNGSYRAIVIGNNRYRDINKVWKPLKTAVSDAVEVARVLENDYGFSDVTLMRNATRRQILLAINDLRSRVNKNDSVLLYYAGHGYMDTATQEAYWIPVDAQGWDDSFFLSNARIKEKFTTIASKARHTLIVSDSCFSGTLLRGVRGIKKPAIMNEPYYRKVSERRSVQIMAAGGVEFVDDDYKMSGHSPYTYFFLNELKKNEGRFLTSSNLASSLTRLVANNVNQTPQFGVLFGAGDEGGEFVFTRTSASVVAKGNALLAMNSPSSRNSMTDAIAIELNYWNSIKSMNDADMYQSYLRKFPEGSFVEIANRKLQIVRPKSDIDKIAEVINRYKISIEAKDKFGIEQVSDNTGSRDVFIKNLFDKYQSYRVKIAGFQHIKGQKRALVKIHILNLVDSRGKSVAPMEWTKYTVIVKQNRKNQWKIFW